MKELIETLHHYRCQGVVELNTGEKIYFYNKGIIDLFRTAIAKKPFLYGSKLADKVIGKGAALLIVNVGVKQVYADIISKCAYDFLNSSGVNVQYKHMVENILNRDKTDICPIEKLTLYIEDPEEAITIINDFFSNNN